MRKGQYLENIHHFKFSINQTLSASATEEFRESMPKGFEVGICHIYNAGTSQNNGGGFYMFSADTDDAVGRGDQFFTGNVAASGGSQYTFENWRPKVFNKSDDSLVADNIFGNPSTSKIDLVNLYIDTSTDELVLEFNNSQTGSRTLDIVVVGKLFSHIDL